MRRVLPEDPSDVDFLYFILLVSSLIFIHESGHFAFAKIFGVKVLTFSIGFGPRVLRLRGKETEYCVALLPFGGFVTMLEESKTSEPILPEERGRTFEAQSLWKRVVIVLAGPAMNLLFPIALYTSVYLEDEQQPCRRRWVWSTPGWPPRASSKPGDRSGRSTGIGHQLSSRSRGDLAANGKPVAMTLERDSKALDVVVTPERRDRSPTNSKSWSTRGQIGVDSAIPRAVIGVFRNPMLPRRRRFGPSSHHGHQRPDESSGLSTSSTRFPTIAGTRSS